MFKLPHAVRPPADPGSDAELLARFAATGDEAAFAVLRRYGGGLVQEKDLVAAGQFSGYGLELPTVPRGMP